MLFNLKTASPNILISMLVMSLSLFSTLLKLGMLAGQYKYSAMQPFLTDEDNQCSIKVSIKKSTVCFERPAAISLTQTTKYRL